MMDNFIFDITSNQHMDAALTIGFSGRKTASHWRVKGNQLELAWTDPKSEGWHPFLTPQTPEEVKPHIIAWLEQSAEYGTEPDIDGSCGKAWRMWTESWGQIGHEWQVFLAVAPAWAMFGK